MRRDQVDHVVRLLAELSRLQNKLGKVQDRTTTFKLEIRCPAKGSPYDSDFIGHCDGVNEKDGTVPFSFLAIKLREAATDYLQSQIALINNELKTMGVED